MSNKSPKIEIIYQDDNIIVINKPSGTSVTKDRTGKEDILPILQKQLKLDEIRLIHRLDKLTSGAMMLAKTPEAQSKYSSMFEKREIKKTYLMLSRGFTHKEDGVVKAGISQSTNTPGTMYVNPKRGKSALTKWRMLAEFGSISLIAASPVTGRTHQIRVHMSHVGLPLAIDPVYGSSQPIMLSEFKPGYRVRKGREENPLIDRLTLHSYQLTVPTDDGGEITYVAPPEKKFMGTIKMLAKHNPNGLEAFIYPEDLENILNGKPLKIHQSSQPAPITPQEDLPPQEE